MSQIEECKKEETKSKKHVAIRYIIMDLILYLVCMGAFLMYFYILPHHYNGVGKVVTTIDSSQKQFDIEKMEDVYANRNTTASDDTIKETLDEKSDNTLNPTSKDRKEDRANVSGSHGKKPQGSKEKQQYVGNTHNDNTSNIVADMSAGEKFKASEKTIEEVQKYADDKTKIKIHKVSTGTGNDKVTYYVSDIKISNISYFRTGFASKSYGKNIRQTVKEMSNEYNAILAMSGDYYGNTETSVVIRNGVLYRSDVKTTDICVLFKNGTMKVYSPEDFNSDKVIKAGAWQAWTFGPSLVDEGGEVSSIFNSTSYINGEHPRAALGYIEPGHYVFVVVDGRAEGYSRGVTLSELSGIMSEIGCKVAYNLDGGRSAAMVYGDTLVDQPYEGGRTISDILYIGEE